MIRRRLIFFGIIGAAVLIVVATVVID